MFSVGALRASGFLSGSRSSHSDAHTVTARAAPVGSTPSRAQPQRETIAPLQMAWGSIDTGRGRHEVAAVQQREVASGRLRELTVHGLELTEAERTEAERSAVQRAEAERSALARAERTPRSLPSAYRRGRGACGSLGGVHGRARLAASATAAVSREALRSRPPSLSMLDRSSPST